MNKGKAEKTEDKENAKQKDKLIKKAKRFIKSRWFPLKAAVAVVVLAVGIVLIMLLFGWKITYAPTLENKWDAISGVADWVSIIVSILSAIASFMAVVFAVRVANKQNQIELFEKRYELYEIIENCIIFSYTLENTTIYEEIRMGFLSLFIHDNESSINSDAEAKKIFPVEYRLILTKLRRSIFLFSNPYILYEIKNLICALGDICRGSFTQEGVHNLDAEIKTYIEFTRSPNYQKLVDEMSKELTLD